MKRFSFLFAPVLVALIAIATAVVTAQIRPQPQLLGIIRSDALFDDTVLHEIRLTVNTTDWQTLKDHYLENTYYPADFRWRDQVVRNVGIRSRGTGSRSPIKPHLLVNFGRYTTGGTFLGLHSIVLRNNTQDPSNMHERLSMLLFARMKIPASREAFTKLYINEEYAGLYTIVEPVEEQFLRRTFGDDTGYLFSLDYPADAQPYHFEYRGSDPALYVPLPFKPETHSSNPRPEYVSDFIAAINLTGDAAFRSVIADYVDLSEFVRQVAIEAYLEDDDGLMGNWGMNNFFMYRRTESKQFTFIPWDKSDAFNFGFGRSIWQNILNVPESLQNRLMTRALQYPDVFNQYLDTLMQAVQSAGQVDNPAVDPRGWLEREIQREYDQIRDAALADPVKPYSNAQFETAVADLGVIARHRGDAVGREVGQARAAGGVGGLAAARRQGDPAAAQPFRR